ncbi:hypothetical protein M407DRAFT_26773 [Tulasnella calospora MUT 4182]|uniref:F-box domain-containing protein n=1 Tax=Tulasnella calospora MUT 4182 TaxID=1051891 RepID=A0A0C3QF32_9AGAM|nr:hypothetical protein M407DRAFT_26773 [Tulasnella calospora MUT 4182]
MTVEDPTHEAVSTDVDIESDEAAEEVLDETTEPTFIPPPVPRALRIPEVLLEIFVASTDSTRAAAARVCRSWSSLALDVLWRDMESPIPLLQVLSPLQPKQTPEQDGETYDDWDFANGLFDVDWTRFHSYATRIRTLVYRLNDPAIGSKNNCLSPRALERVALLYPQGRCLVPNIQELRCHVTWDEAVQTIPAFVGPNLKTLAMSFCTGMPGRCLKGLFQALVSRTAMLDHFHLSTDCPVVEFEGALAKWFESTPLLTEAELPRYYQTEAIVETLGRLESLRSLATVWDNHLPYDAHGVHFQLSQDSFPGLTNLDIEGHLDYALATLQTSPQLSRIKCICLTSYRAPTSEEVLNLTTALALACPVLDVVWLNLASEDDTTTTEPLAFEVFRPLLECHQVTEFVVGHDMPLLLEESDVDEMAEKWPELKVLLLTRDPNHPPDNLTSEYGLDLSILAHMAQKLRNLTNLGLFLDVERFTDFEGNLDPPHQFEKLIVLDVGCSPIPVHAVSPVGLYLGSLIVSPDAWIQCSMEPWFRGTRGDPKFTENWGRWYNAYTLMNMVTRSKVVSAKTTGMLRQRHQIESLNNR